MGSDESKVRSALSCPVTSFKVPPQHAKDLTCLFSGVVVVMIPFEFMGQEDPQILVMFNGG